MSKELSLVLEDGIAFQTGPDMAQLYIDGDVVPLDQGTLGKLGEWLAMAWENVAGEEYKPVVISERGYVADEGIPVIVKRAAPLPMFTDKLERDCE